MNYIIKGVLTKIFTRFLQLSQEGLDFESGIIRLPRGNINHTRLNQILAPLGLTFTQSLYQNLTIHAPIIELTSKPIKISIETLETTIVRTKKPPNTQTEDKQQSKQRQYIRQQNQDSNSYLRNILNRLLYNMEIHMHKINIKLIDEALPQEPTILTITQLHLKNSLVILEAGIIKKTLLLKYIGIKHPFGQVSLSELNLCLDYNPKKLSVIALLGQIHIHVHSLPLVSILKGIPSSNNTSRKQSTSKVNVSSKLDLSVYVKISKIKVDSRFITADTHPIEVRLSQSSEGKDLSIQLQRIQINNSSTLANSSTAQPLLYIGYLDAQNRQVSIQTEFEDAVVKHCLVACKFSEQLVNARVFHLIVMANADQLKLLLDELIILREEIIQLATIIVSLTSKSSIISNQNQNQKQIQQKQPQQPKKKTNVSLLLYRVMAQLSYQNCSLKLFGTINIQSKPTIKAIILQLGVKLIGYNLLALRQVSISVHKTELVISGATLAVEVSLYLVNKCKTVKNAILRDTAYYKQKFKDLLSIIQNSIKEDKSIHSDQEQNKNIGSSVQKEPTLRLDRVYLKLAQATVGMGELFPYPESTFISLIQMQIIDISLRVASSRVSCKASLMCFMSSPYTLHRTPLTNQLQVWATLHTDTGDCSINFKTDLILLVQDYYFNIIFKIMDEKQVWSLLRNQTHLPVTLIQQDNHIVTLVQQPLQQMQLKTKVGPGSSQPVLWLQDKAFRVQIGDKISQQMDLSGEQQETQKEIYLGEQRDYDYVLRITCNKLNNLTSLTIDYKNRISAYQQGYLLMVNSQEVTVPKHKYALQSDSAPGQGFYLLDDLPQELAHYTFSKQERKFELRHLMTNQTQTILGLVQKIGSLSLHQAYLLRSLVGKSIRYTLMPFLVITNSLHTSLSITITDKKTQEKEILKVDKQETLSLGSNGRFDYCLRQLTIQIELNQDGAVYQSQQLYFNTFFMVQHHSQTPVLLRSTRRQDYSKRGLVMSQNLLLRSKVITFRAGLKVKNNTSFDLLLWNGQAGSVQVSGGQCVQWASRMRQDGLLGVMLALQPQSRIQVEYRAIKQPHILSFNFAKLKERFYNVLLKIERKGQVGNQSIQISYFVQIVNLCRHSTGVGIQQFPQLSFEQRCLLPLSASSMSKYNNRAVQIDDLPRIYAQVFLTSKVTDHPLTLRIAQTTISFSRLLSQGNSELLLNQGNRTVITLLKDMANGRITFYLTDRLCSSKVHLTLFSNQSDKCFLLADDGQYSLHFTQQQTHTTRPDKIFIPKRSVHCLLERENYQLLLCDENQQHLGRPDRKALEREAISLQQYNFHGLTLIDCDLPRGPSARRQLSTKGIQIRLKVGRKVQVVFSVKSLALRWLQRDKVDLLVQDLGVRNQQSQGHLLRIPQQTYLLLEGKMLRDGHFLLIRNCFIKCRNIIVNIRRQMPFALATLLGALSQRATNKQQTQQVGARQFRERLRRRRGQDKLRQCVNQALLLVRHVFIHQVHLSLTIQLQGINFSNAMILPQFQSSNRYLRAHTFSDQLSTYYLSNVLAKFPKLSFIASSLTSPLSVFKLFFNIRQALREKTTADRIIDLKHSLIPQNPFYFARQRWNVLVRQLDGRQGWIWGVLFEVRRYLLVTGGQVCLVGQGVIQLRQLRQVEWVRVTRSGRGSQLVIGMRSGQRWVVREEKKQCVRMVNAIQRLLL